MNSIINKSPLSIPKNAYPTKSIISSLVHRAINMFIKNKKYKIPLTDMINTMQDLHNSNINLVWYHEDITEEIKRVKFINLDDNVIYIITPPTSSDTKIIIEPEPGVYIYCREHVNLSASSPTTLLEVKIGKSIRMSSRVKKQAQTIGETPKILFKLLTKNEDDAKNLERLMHAISALKGRNVDKPNGAREWFSYTIGELKFLINVILISNLNLPVKVEEVWCKVF